MTINVAHLRDQGISFAVFDADAPSHTRHDRDVLLRDLTRRTRLIGWRVDKAALAFIENGRLTYYGTPDLVKYLAGRPAVLRWTHTLDI